MAFFILPRARFNSAGTLVPIDEPRHRDPGRSWRSSRKWQQLSRSVVAAAGTTCPSCHEQISSDNPMTADHVVPVSEGGGRFDLANLAPLCRRCNSRKGAR